MATVTRKRDQGFCKFGIYSLYLWLAHIELTEYMIYRNYTHTGPCHRLAHTYTTIADILFNSVSGQLFLSYVSLLCLFSRLMIVMVTSPIIKYYAVETFRE